MTTPRHAPRVPFAVLVTALIVGGLALLLLLNTVSAANEVRRHGLVAADQTVAAQLQELRNEVAASAAPGNLAQAAAALGMMPAGNPAFLVIEADGSVRVLGSAAPASQTMVAQQPHRSTKKPTTTPKASKTATSTSRTSTAHPTGHSSTSASTTAARPTPTPTPTLTLPGGNR